MKFCLRLAKITSVLCAHVHAASTAFIRAAVLLTVAAIGHAEVASPSNSASGPATQRVYLSGRGSDDAVEWEFFCSEGRRSGEWTKIRVPSCWELEGFGNYQYGIRYYGKAKPPGIAKEQGIYRTSFQAPESWRGQRVFIVFEGVMTDAHVRINGIHSHMFHQGGFYRFRFDISHLLKFGASNELVVTVDKESANDSVNMAERRADYWNFGGIFRPVFLEIMPVEHIERCAVVAEADGRLDIDVFLGGAVTPDTTIQAELQDVSGKRVGDVLSAMVPPGSDRVSLAGNFSGVQTWTAETPHLYKLRLTRMRAARAQHVLEERIGFRTFQVKPGEGFFLNGTRVLFKGVNRHSFWPDTGRTLSRERNYADARLIKELNMNAVRLSHYPPDPEFLDACDELGLYVLNELGGWHHAYDTGIGRQLVGEMVRRDVNHPSILFWDNGNEGGWNTELDGEFHRWDPQRRPVLHPQKTFSGIATSHYRSFGETQEFLRAPEIFMPTEFLHGLYDGGHAAGLHDYWEMMRQHRRAGGGFLWVLADEGVKRTDENGRIDTMGNYGADGIVGPYHEREGSFDAIREIWSPIQLSPRQLPVEFDGTLSVENRYDFTALDQCRFRWSLGELPAAGANTSARTIASGELNGPAIAPHGRGSLKIPLPPTWREADVLYVSAVDPTGREVWKWSWTWANSHPPKSIRTNKPTGHAATIEEVAGGWRIKAGAAELEFSKATGRLERVKNNGKALPLQNGPRFIAARRGDRTLDGTVNPEAPKGVDRVYQEIATSAALTAMRVSRASDRVTVESEYTGPLQRTHWSVLDSGAVELEYEYTFDGVVELMGVQFDADEAAMRGMRWVGRGPYRVWQNRLHGGTVGVWEKSYNDSIPGDSWVYPEFKGYHQDWRWARFTTPSGDFTIANHSPEKFLGVLTPRDGRDAMLFTLPQTGIAFLDVIPAIRNKVNATDLVGPSSRPQHVQGVRRGRVVFYFAEP